MYGCKKNPMIKEECSCVNTITKIDSSEFTRNQSLLHLKLSYFFGCFIRLIIGDQCGVILRNGFEVRKCKNFTEMRKLSFQSDSTTRQRNWKNSLGQISTGNVRIQKNVEKKNNNNQSGQNIDKISEACCYFDYYFQNDEMWKD